MNRGVALRTYTSDRPASATKQAECGVSVTRDGGWQWLKKKRQSLRTMQQTLLPLSGYRHLILGFLFLHLERTLRQDETARRIGLPSGTLTRELVRQP